MEQDQAEEKLQLCTDFVWRRENVGGRCLIFARDYATGSSRKEEESTVEQKARHPAHQI